MIESPYRVRPIDAWPGEQTRNRRRSPFRSSWSNTTRLLETELAHLGARDVVLLAAVTEDEIRLDGRLRASARPSHPGVVLAFDSRYGPLKYAVDTFDAMEDNLRAIALGLEALRKVDRYGVTRRGEQYTGWRQLEAGDGQTSRDDAWLLLCDVAGVLVDSSPLLNGLTETDVIRLALKAAHPDTGGDDETFRRVLNARRVLEASNG